MPRKSKNAKKGRKRTHYMKNIKSGVDLAQKVATLGMTVAKLVSMTNAEKKRFVISLATNTSFGQSNGAVTGGTYSADVTPIPAQGTTSITRTGNSIKLHKSYLQVQLSQLSACVSPVNVSIEIWLVKGQVFSSAASGLQALYSQNPFVLNAGSPAIIDYNSNINPDYFGQFIKIAQRKVRVSPDQFSGQNTIKDVRIPIKYFKNGHHIRFAADGSTTISEGQLLMFIRADNGNANASTACTLTNALNTAVSTGLSLNYNLIHYFYDN